jgi:VanZ family protein
MRDPHRLWQVAAALWAGTIMVTGLLPTQRAVEAVSGGHDDVATLAGHFVAYALLGGLLGVALEGGELFRGRVVLAWVMAATLGVFIELVQAPLPYRDAQVVDALVNAAGAAVGLLLLSVAALAMRSRSRHG